MDNTDTGREANPPASMDTSRATPDLYAALAAAQADVTSVGKDGTNTQRGYRYATTEAMIRGARQHLAAHGLAFFSTWTQAVPAPPQGDIGKQHVAATVSIHWVVGHASGGQISGVATMDAIGSPARPPDKAVAAAVTYALGFVLRGLLLLDRADEDEHAVDQRREPEPDRLWLAYTDRRDALAQRLKLSIDQAHTRIREAAGVTYPHEPTDQQVEQMIAAAERLLTAPENNPEPTKVQRKGPKAKPEAVEPDQGPKAQAQALRAARASLTSAAKAYAEEAKEQGVDPLPWTEIASRGIGKPWDPEQHHTVEEWLAGASAFEEEIQRLRGDK